MTDSSRIGNRQDLPLENGARTELLAKEKITTNEAADFAGVGMFQVKLIILSGFVWMARGFELIIVSSVSPLLSCEWNLRRWHGALLSTITYISTILGCFLYGIWSDKYGRRMALSSSLIFLFVFGAVSAGLPNFPWFVIFRAVAGFSIGGFAQTFVLCCEFFPGRQRGRAIYILSCFWALGVLIMLWILYSTMYQESNWRIFVAIGTLPAFVAMILMRFFPESFRYLMVADQHFTKFTQSAIDERYYTAANEIMTEMAETNGKNISAKLMRLPPMRPRRLVLDFFKMPFVRSSILFWMMGLVTTISFLGLEDITPQLYQGVPMNIASNITRMDFMGDIYQPIMCFRSMQQEEFVFMVWTTALDFPSFVIYMILVDLINRKILLCISYVLSSLFIFLLFIPTRELIVSVIFIYCARTLLHGQFDLLILMVAEAFPTSHRGTAVGFEVAVFYAGQFLSSYINGGALLNKIINYVIVYGVLTLCCALACLGLIHETAGIELQDSLKKENRTSTTMIEEDAEDHRGRRM